MASGRRVEIIDVLAQGERSVDDIGGWAGTGRLTIAEHILLAVGEWHIQGWDLSRAAGGDSQPSAP